MEVFDQDNDIEYGCQVKLPHVIKSWCPDIEEGAWQQALNLAHLPFLFRHVALMSDCHQGFGMPIGGVIATKGVIIPYAVGYDVGCGMVSVKTSLTEIDQQTIKRIMGGSKEFKGGIRSKIPIGFKHHSKKQDEKLMPLFDGWFDGVRADLSVVAGEYQSALKQVGTLGGGK